MESFIVIRQVKPTKQIAEEVASKVCEGVCLQCGKKRSEQKRPFRFGNCDVCYMRTWNLLRQMTEQAAAEYELELIRRGLWVGRGAVARIQREAKSLAARIAAKFLKQSTQG